MLRRFSRRDAYGFRVLGASRREGRDGTWRYTNARVGTRKGPDPAPPLPLLAEVPLATDLFVTRAGPEAVPHVISASILTI